MFRSIKTKILVSHFVLVLSVAVALGAITYMIMFNSLRDSQKQNLEYIAEQLGGDLNTLIDNRKQLIEKIGTSEVIKNYFKKQQEHLLTEHFNKFMPQFPVLSYVNENGLEKFKLINGKISTEFFNIRDSEIFKEATRHTNRPIVSYHASCPEGGGPYIHFSFCNKSYSDEFIGLILGKVPLATLAKDIRDFRLGQSGFAILLDTEGTVLSCWDKDKLLKKVTLEGVDANQLISRIKAMQSGFGRAKILGIDSYLAYAPVQGQNWSVVSILPYEEFLAKLDTLGNAVLLVSLFILVTGSALSLVVAAHIANPLLELANVADSVAEGDLSQRVNITSRDEIGNLGEAFNHMTKDLQETTTSIYNLNREIIERNKAEQKMEYLNKELEAMVEKLTVANRELRDFAHIAAHDLKSPLRAIGSLASIIAGDYADKLDEQGKEKLGLLVGRTERMGNLLDGILRYSELGRVMSEKEKADLTEVVQESIAEIAPPENIEVTVENELPVIMCEKTQLLQVFQNLIGNAVRYMDKANGRIRIRCDDENGFWKFSVADNGPGIEEKYFEKIFQVFQTLTRRDEVESTGIGLSLVRKIIEVYNGKVWVESQPGQGSTFFFTLPKQEMRVKDEKLEPNIVS